MSIFPIQLENVHRVVIYLLTMAVREHNPMLALEMAEDEDGRGQT